MNESALLLKHRKLINYIADKYSTKINPKLHVNDLEDFRSEAVIAAIKAIRSYKENKQQKLTTYIATCIRNRMADINRSVNSKNKIRHLVYNSKLLENIIDREHTMFNPVEMSIMHQILDGTLRSEIIKNYSQENNIEIRKSKEFIESCLCHIHHKLKSSVQNQN